MHIFIRCDSSYEIGHGHLMRCLVVADQCRKYGHEPHFICAPKEGNLNHLIVAGEYPLHLLSGVDLDPVADAQESLKVIELHKNALVVVDHYDLGQSWEAAFYKTWKVIVIEDVENRAHRCDILIDINYRSDYSAAYEDLLPGNCQKILGPSQAFLRNEFIESKPLVESKNESAVLVFFGGSDLSNETGRFLEALEKAQVQGTYHIIVSQGYKHAEEISQLPPSKKFKIHSQPKAISQLMKTSRLYFGSGGTITWERLYLGLPGVVVATAANQERIARELGQDGFQKYLGPSKKVNYGAAIAVCESQLINKDWLTLTRKKGEKLVGPFRAEMLFRLLSV